MHVTQAVHRSSRAQHVILIQDARHKDPREHCKTPVKIPHGRHTHAFIKRGWSSVPWTSPWPSGATAKAGRFLVEEKLPLGGTLDPCSWSSIWKRCKTSLDRITRCWSRCSEATCWSALGGCKQVELSLRPARKLLPLFPSFPVDRLLRLFTLSSSSLSLPFLFSRVAPFVLRGFSAPFACACTIPASLCRPADLSHSQYVCDAARPPMAV